MHCGIGAMGPYSHANVTIGRAHALLSQNLQGGSVVGDTYMGSIGNAYNYACTWAENEERSPWEPLHVQHGFKPGKWLADDPGEETRCRLVRLSRPHHHARQTDADAVAKAAPGVVGDFLGRNQDHDQAGARSRSRHGFVAVPATKKQPCRPPQNTKVHDAPCHSPPSSIVIIRLM